MSKPQAGQPRDRINHLQVTVNADERERIKARAARRAGRRKMINHIVRDRDLP